MFPAKINNKIFQNKEKTLFWGGFCPKKFLQKTLAKYNWSGPPAFRCQSYRADWQSNQKLFHHYQHAKTIQ